MSTSPEVAAFIMQLKEPIPDALVAYLSRCREVAAIEDRDTTPNPSLVHELRRAADILKTSHGYTPETLELLADNYDEIHDAILAEFMPPSNPPSSKASMEAA